MNTIGLNLIKAWELACAKKKYKKSILNFDDIINSSARSIEISKGKNLLLVWWLYSTNFTGRIIFGEIYETISFDEYCILSRLFDNVSKSKCTGGFSPEENILLKEFPELKTNKIYWRR